MDQMTIQEKYLREGGTGTRKKGGNEVSDESKKK